MVTGLFSHAECLGHRTPPGHPERVARVTAVLDALRPESFPDLVRFEAPAAERGALLRAHNAALVDGILATVVAGDAFAQLDADTAMSSGSVDAARRGAGAAILAADEIMAGRLRNAFCAIRPPGHHAEHARAMGFCLFNNAAVGALHARAVHGMSRVAVVDFDVHHGNGTQDIFFADPDLFYASTHQFPLYPGTGLESETGVAGNIVNVPLPPGAGSAAFRAEFAARILPALDAFAPEFVFVSAGFDAHHADPLGGLRLEEDDFAWATMEICAVADRHCRGRVVSVLEGGYDLEALARSAAAHVDALQRG